MYHASFNEAEIGFLYDMLLEDFMNGGRTFECVTSGCKTDTEAMLGKITSIRLGRAQW